MFSIELNGYNKMEVEDKITELEIENVQLKKTCEEKNGLNLKLVSAVDKVKEIETNSQYLHNLKLQKLALLSQTFEQNFKSLLNKFPQLKKLVELKVMIDKYLKEIKNVLQEEYEKKITSPVKTENDTIRLLLNKMSLYAKQKESDYSVKTDSIKRKPELTKATLNSSIPKPASAPSMTTEKRRAKSNAESLMNSSAISQAKNLNLTKNSINPSQIKPIINMVEDGFEDDLCNKFLSTKDDFSDNAYARMLSKRPDAETYPTPNESGFDLKEAVNPKENLEEIMKSFHFTD